MTPDVIINALISAGLCAAALFVFMLFDVNVFFRFVQPLAKALNVPVETIDKPYRVAQVMFQFTIYALLISLHRYGALAGFIAGHNLLGCDWLYYLFTKEKYKLWPVIDWFKVSLVQIVSRVFRGRWISGQELSYVGPAALAVGLIIAIVFA